MVPRFSASAAARCARISSTPTAWIKAPTGLSASSCTASERVGAAPASTSTTASLRRTASKHTAVMPRPTRKAAESSAVCAVFQNLREKKPDMSVYKARQHLLVQIQIRRPADPQQRKDHPQSRSLKRRSRRGGETLNSRSIASPNDGRCRSFQWRLRTGSGRVPGLPKKPPAPIGTR